MSPRNWRERIRDILDAIAEIEEFTRGMDYGSFIADAETVKAVELNLIVMARLPAKFLARLKNSIRKYPGR